MKRKKKSLLFLLIIVLIVVVAILIVKKVVIKKQYEIEKIGKYKYFKIYENEKYGVIDESGNIIINPEYDVLNIPNPTIPVFVCYYNYNDNTGEYETKVLNEKNNEIFTAYDEVTDFECQESSSNIPFEKSTLRYKKNGKYGIMNFKGKKITKPIYDSIKSLEYKEGTFLVEKNGKYGVVDCLGQTIIEIKYDGIVSDAYYLEEKDYTQAGFIVQNKEQDGYKYGYLDYKGKKLLETEYIEIKRILEIEDTDNIFLMVSKNGKYGIQKNKKMITEITYDEIEFNKTNNLFIVEKNEKQGVISIEGKSILPIEYDYVLCVGSKINTTKDDIVEIFNIDGQKQEEKYTNIIETKNENFLIEINEEQKYGVVSKNFKVLINNEYEYIEYAFDNYFVATKNGKFGLVNTNGIVKIDFKYDVIQKIKDKNALQAILVKENIVDVYNSKIELQCGIKDAIVYTYDNYIKLLSNNDLQYFDNEGNKIENTQIFNNKLYAYKQNGKWGFVDENQKVVVQTKYDLVTEFNEFGFAGIKKDNKWGVVDKNGNIIIEPVYIVNWNDPEFISKYCKLNYGYGYEYYTDEISE